MAIIFDLKDDFFNKTRDTFLRVLLSSFTLSGCISSTTIHSSDPTAEIYLVETGAHKIGQIESSDRKPMWGHLEVEIRKAGCASKSYRISKFDDFYTESFLSMLVIGSYAAYGGAAWAGLLPAPWLTKYRDDYTLEYTCEGRK